MAASNIKTVVSFSRCLQSHEQTLHLIVQVGQMNFTEIIQTNTWLLSWEIQAWIVGVGHQNISMALYTIGSPIITNMKMDPNSRAVVTVSQSCLNVRKVLWEDNNSVDTTLIEASSRNLSNANF